MDARVIIASSVSGDLSLDRFYLSCFSSFVFKINHTPIFAVGGGTNSSGSIRQLNRNTCEIGKRTGLFGAFTVFFALCGHSNRGDYAYSPCDGGQDGRCFA